MFFTKDKNKDKGFTIVELIVCIAIIAVISSVLIPTFTVAINNASDVAVQSTLKDAYLEYYLKNQNSEKCLPQEEVFFNYEGFTYGYEDNAYSKVKSLNGEVILAMEATDYGFIEIQDVYNGMTGYYLSENVSKDNLQVLGDKTTENDDGSMQSPTDDTDDSSQSETGDNTKEDSDSSSKEEQVINKLTEIKSQFMQDENLTEMQLDMYCFAVKVEGETYRIYTYDIFSNAFVNSMYDDTTLSEMEIWGLELIETYNDVLVYSIF